MIKIIENETKQLHNINLDNNTPFAFLQISQHPKISKIKLKNAESMTIANSFMYLHTAALKEDCIIHNYSTSYGCLALNISPYIDIKVTKLNDNEILINYPTDDTNKGYIVFGNLDKIQSEINETQILIKNILENKFDIDSLLK
jgi:hypothetical protein